MMRDDKLVRVSIKSKQTIERVLWVWGAILESAAEIDNAGRYDVDTAEIAYFLRADEDDIRAVLHAFEELGRLDSGCVVKWGVRQFQSDRSATRVAAHRERKRAGNADIDVTADRGNGDVTLQKRHGNAPETETETETEEEVICASGDTLKPEHIVEIWNESAPRLGKPTVRALTPSRRDLLKNRISQYSLADFQDVFGKIERSAFLRGDSGWHGCTFDWVFKRANFQKIIEGNYD
jgi:hypothetical protein